MPLITDQLVADAAPRARDYCLWDDQLSGFGLKVTPRGARIFVVQYRVDRGGSRTRRYTIGAAGKGGVAEARRIAAQIKDQVAHGLDPMGAPQRSRRAHLRVRAPVSPKLAARPMRERILEAAEREFTQKHFGLSLGSIALSAAVSRQAIYEHFGSRQGLMDAVIEKIMRIYSSDILSIEDDGDLHSTLHVYAHRYLDISIAPKTIAMLRMFYTERTGSRYIAQQILGFGPERMMETLAEFFFAKFSARGATRQSCAIAAEQFFCSVRGFEQNRAFVGLGTRRHDRQAYVAQVVSSFVRGLPWPTDV